MSREREFGFNGSRSLHADRLAHGAHRFPAAFVSVLARVVRIDFVDVQVFLVDIEPGESERDRAVVTYGCTWKRGLACADDVDTGCIQVSDVAEAGRTVGPV